MKGRKRNDLVGDLAIEELPRIFMRRYVDQLLKMRNIDSIIFSLPSETVRMRLVKEAFALNGVPISTGAEVITKKLEISDEEIRSATDVLNMLLKKRSIGCYRCFIGKSADESACEAYYQLRLVEEFYGGILARIIWLGVLLTSEYVPYADRPVVYCGAEIDIPTTMASNASLYTQLTTLLKEGNNLSMARWLTRVPCTEETREALIAYALIRNRRKVKPRRKSIFAELLDL